MCTNTWSYSHVNYVAKKSPKPFLRVGWLYCTNWIEKKDQETSLAYTLISSRNKSRRLESHLKVHMQRFTCLCTFYTHASPKKASKEWSYDYLTIFPPQYRSWYLNRIHPACERKKWRHYYALKIGMPHLPTLSSNYSVWRSLCMFCESLLSIYLWCRK